MAYKFSKMLFSDDDLKTELERSPFKRKIHSILRRFRVDGLEKQKLNEKDIPLKGNDTVWPVCVCSGRILHPDLEWTFCPVTGMPGLYSEYIKYLGANESGLDPICGKGVRLSQLKKVRL